MNGPTIERLRHSDGDFDVANDPSSKKYTMQDSPLDRMWKRGGLTGAEHSALDRYRSHWYHAGLEASVGSVDLNRIFASDPGSFSGMAKSEKQANHRQQYREARKVIGHRSGIVVDNVVCCEWSLEIAGHAMGWGNKVQARAAATEILRGAAYMLKKHWGIG